MNIYVVPLTAGRRSLQYENNHFLNTVSTGALNFGRPSVTEATHPTRLHGEAGALNYATYSPIYPISDITAVREERNIEDTETNGGARRNSAAWAAQQKDLFFRVESELQGLVNVEKEEMELKKRVNKSEANLRTSRKHLQEAQNEVVRAEKSIENASRFGFTKRFRKQKFEKEVSEGAAQKENAESQVTLFAEQVEMLRIRNDNDRKEHAEAQRKVIRKRGLRKQKKQILHNLFSGLQTGDEQENRAELKRNQIREQWSKNRAALVDAMKGLSHITKGVRALKNVIVLLQSAHRSNTMDLHIHGNSGFGQFAAHQTLMNMNRASQLARQANEEIEKAANCSPHMPVPQQAQVRQSIFDFRQLFTDSLYSDLRQRYKIEQQMSSSRAVYEQAFRAMTWQEKFVNEVRLDLRKLESLLEEAEEDLMAERIRLISHPVG